MLLKNKNITLHAIFFYFLQHKYILAAIAPNIGIVSNPTNKHT